MEPAGRDKGLNEHASQRIGEELKAFYDGLVNEPLPDRFVDLLQKLEQREEKKRCAGGGSNGGDA